MTLGDRDSRKSDDDDDDSDIEKGVSGENNEVKEEQDIVMNERFWPMGRRKPTMKETIIVGLGLVAVCFNVICCLPLIVPKIIPIVSISVIYASTAISGLTAPIMMYQESELTKLATFRGVLNDVREQVNEFSSQNQKLHSNVNELEEHVGRLKEIESGLSSIASTQGQQVDNLVELVKENGEIIKELKEVLKARALQSMITLVMEVDSDFDFSLGPSEIDKLVVGVSLIPDIEFNEKGFRDLIKQSNGSVNGILDIMKSLMGADDGDNGDNQSVRTKDTKQFLNGTKGKQ